MHDNLPRCKFCGSKLIARNDFTNRKSYDFYRRFRKCQKCQDWDAKGRKIVKDAIERRRKKKQDRQDSS